MFITTYLDSLCLSFSIQLLRRIGNFSGNFSLGYVSIGPLLLLHVLCIDLGFFGLFLCLLAFCKVTNILTCTIFSSEKLPNYINSGRGPLIRISYQPNKVEMDK